MQNYYSISDVRRSIIPTNINGVLSYNYTIQNMTNFHDIDNKYLVFKLINGQPIEKVASIITLLLDNIPKDQLLHMKYTKNKINTDKNTYLVPRVPSNPNYMWGVDINGNLLPYKVRLHIYICILFRLRVFARKYKYVNANIIIT